MTDGFLGISPQTESRPAEVTPTRQHAPVDVTLLWGRASVPQGLSSEPNSSPLLYSPTVYHTLEEGYCYGGNTVYVYTSDRHARLKSVSLCHCILLY